MSKSINQLKLDKQLKLADFMGVQEEWLKGKLPTYKEVADKASSVLGFSVTEYNVQSINVAKGMIWQPRRGGRTGEKKAAFQKWAAQVASEVVETATEKLRAELQEQLDKLSSRLDHLIKALGGTDTPKGEPVRVTDTRHIKIAQ